jgi:Selenoprotein, putative
MRAGWRKTKHGLRNVWQGLREWCGDSAYENYRNCAVRSGRKDVLSREQFYVAQLNQKYSRPSRCC